MTALHDIEGAPVIVGGGLAGLSRHSENGSDFLPRNPLEVMVVFRFALLLAAVTVMTRATLAVFGTQSLIAVAFIVPAEISFSCWFFHFVTQVENVIAALRTGLEPNVYTSAFPALYYQGSGAMLMLFALLCWSARHQFRAVLVAAFAGLALVLAMVGLFGVLAYAVQRQVRDFGVRRALGATTRDLIVLVGGRAVKVIGAGSVLGLVVAPLIGRMLETMLFGVKPLDFTTFAVVTLVVAAAAVLSALVRPPIV